MTTAKLGATEQRWASELAVFDFDLRYRSGRSNKNADALSRQNTPVPLEVREWLPGTEVPAGVGQVLVAEKAAPVTQSVVLALPSFAGDLRVLQEADPVIGEILAFWKQGIRPTLKERKLLSKPGLVLLRQWDRLLERQGILHRRIFRPDGGEEIFQLVLPSVLRGEVLTQMHQGHGHQGVDRTTELVQQRCYWPGLTSDVVQWCRDCERCQAAKDSQPVAQSFMGHLLASRPNEILAIDFTLLEPSRLGLENVLVMTDVFTKYTLAVPTRDQRAETVAQVLVTEWFFKFGVPVRIHSDQGRNFESSLIQQLCSLYQIEKSHTTPYHPAGNGQCERFNRTLHGLLRTLPNPRKVDWPSALPQLLFCYNTTPHQSTSESPYFLMFGQEPRLPVDVLLGRGQERGSSGVNDWVLEHQTRLQVAFEGARQHLKAAANRRKERHDLHVRDVPLREGQLVYLRNYGVRGRRKIQDIWSPVVYQVVRAPETGGSIYTIAPVDDSSRVKHVHRSLLKIRIQKDSPISGVSEIPEVVEAPPLEESSSLDEMDLWALVPKTPQVGGRPVTQDLVSSAPSAMQRIAESTEPILLGAAGQSGVKPATSLVVEPLPADEPNPGAGPVRRTGRANAGQHPNHYHLPRAVGEVVQPRATVSNSVSALFRP